MTSGPRQDDAPPDDLLTAEDLFGDLVDGPLEPSARPAPAVRAAPIRVQVSEPGLPGNEEGPEAGQPKVLPEDMAVLLEAFADPGAARVKAGDAAPGPPAQETRRLEPPPGQVLDRSPAPTPESTMRRAGALDEEEARGLLEALGPSRRGRVTEPSVPEAPATPPAAAPSSKSTAEEDAERLVAAIRLPDPPPPAVPRPDQGVDALLAQIEAPRSRTTVRFQAAAPRLARPEAAALDLAAVAEGALGLAHSEAAGSPGKAAPGPASASASLYGPYRLIEKVAVGGMAEVFKAKRAGVEGFEKVVAVKRILPHLSDNKEFVDMFIDEAKMVAGLTHPNIVQIFDLGKLEKSYYIAMEYVHGRDLRSIQKRARERGPRIPLDLSVLIVSKVCSALEYAHRKKDDTGRAMKIVHRDISPQNILISFEGDVKLTDFGIAKAATKASTTDRGALRGKLLYMSPEQAWGKPIDRRSDVFSLGIVFYELITEDKPFLGGSEMSILEMVRECRVSPPSASNPRVPETIERVVMKALERDPDARYQDASEMYRDLERVLLERRPPAASELARLMELLFDEAERGAATGPEDRAAEDRMDPARPALEMEFHASAGGRTDTDPEGEGAPLPRDALSVEQLLKRFGNR